jgi:hypothetical protein
MFAPDQDRAAKELVRVCRPGGKIGLANWTPEGFIGQLFKVVGKHVAPPPGVQSPSRWGVEANLKQMFGDGVSVGGALRNFAFRYRSPVHWVDVFRGTYGPVLKAFEALDAKGQEALNADILALIERFNVTGSTSVVAPAEYFEAVIVKR